MQADGIQSPGMTTPVRTWRANASADPRRERGPLLSDDREGNLDVLDSGVLLTVQMFMPIDSNGEVE